MFIYKQFVQQFGNHWLQQFIGQLYYNTLTIGQQLVITIGQQLILQLINNWFIIGFNNWFIICYTIYKTIGQ